MTSKAEAVAAALRTFRPGDRVRITASFGEPVSRPVKSAPLWARGDVVVNLFGETRRGMVGRIYHVHHFEQCDMFGGVYVLDHIWVSIPPEYLELVEDE